MQPSQPRPDQLTRIHRDEPTRQIRVLIADDHRLARAAIRSILAADPAFTVIAEATSAAEAEQLALSCRPDLLLMDLRMPGGGIQAIRAVRQQSPDIRIVVVTVSDSARDFFEAVRSGAQGYLVKDVSPDEWTSYLRAVMDMNAPLPGKLPERVMREVARVPTQGRRTDLSRLTPREREVLVHVAHGSTNREIARRLHISEHTVKNHLKHILEKLELKNRTQLAGVLLTGDEP